MRHIFSMDHTRVDSATFIRSCAAINFGKIVPAGRELEFYHGLNEAIISFIKGLPGSMQSEAMLFCMRYAGLGIGDRLDFFRNFHAPVWSVIYWAAAGRLVPEQLNDGITAHAMAMLLHSLDDHLTDGELPVNHLTLLIRSQAWLVMQQALARLDEAVPGSARVVMDLIDEYYLGISDTTLPDTLDDYCARFRKQMSTGLIVPQITATIADDSPEYAALIRSAGESFGIAWRLLDDIQDLGEDIRNCRRTAVYCLLPQEGKTLWDSICSDPGACARDDGLRLIIDILCEMDAIKSIIGRICEELNRAAGFAAEAALGGLADEYRSLMAPLKARVPE